MSRAKMVILTDEQHLHVVLSVMTQLRADNATKRTPGDEYDKFLVGEIALGTESLKALNATTEPAREDAVLSAPPGIAAFILAMCDHANGTMIGPDVTEKLQAVYAWLRIETRRTV